MPIKEKNQLSKNLIHFRKLHKMNQKQVAAYLNIPRDRYAKYENNTKAPIDILDRLTELYQIKLDTLVKSVQYTTPKLADELLMVSDVDPVINEAGGLTPEVMEIINRIDGLDAPSKRQLYEEILRKIENE